MLSYTQHVIEASNSLFCNPPEKDRIRTVSRRTKPNSRTAFIGEQPNPWKPIHLQDAMSRHRGAKRLRRYELLGVISLLSLAYLWSVDREPFHTVLPGHYGRLSSLFDLYVLQSGKLLPLRSPSHFRRDWAYLRTLPVLFRKRPPQSNYQLDTVPSTFTM